MDLMRKQSLTSLFIVSFLVFIYIVGSTEADLYDGNQCQLHDGSIALCKRIETCKWLIDSINSHKMKYSEIRNCGFVGNIQFACCADERPDYTNLKPPPTYNVGGDADNIIFDNDLLPPSRPTTSSTTSSSISTSNRIPGRKAEKACLDYTALAVSLLTDSILNGVEAVLGEFPHMAALGYQTFEGLKFVCGGSLISDSWVLTAAHCITSRNRISLVRLGKITITTDQDGASALDRQIADIIRHPRYNALTKKHDIALLRLSEQVPFDDTNIRPACLRTNLDDVPVNEDLYLTGWGATDVERGSVGSEFLLKTNVTMMPVDQCNKTLLQFNRDADQSSLRGGIILGQLCTYDPQARNDACVGDSGGPLQITKLSGVSTIVGVTSFGISCGSTLPSISTRVAFYLDWIEDIVWPDL